MIVRQSARRAGRSFARAAVRQPLTIEPDQPGVRGWWNRSSPARILATFVVGGAGFLIALPIFLIILLILWDELRPGFVAAGIR
ncbi:MAG: hypothetical protein NVSMB20_03110 [Bradyrhizobium sp.]